MRVAIVQPTVGVVTETFIRAHADKLPAETSVISGLLPHIDDRAVLNASSSSLASIVWNLVRGVRPEGDLVRWSYTCGYLRALKRVKPDVVLAEYGHMGVIVCRACAKLGIPLVVHFHGADAWSSDVLLKYGNDYGKMFASANLFVSVSKEMTDQLAALGAPPDRVKQNVYGVDINEFSRIDPGESEPIFLSVGRFVEKKAPHLTILAFGKLIESFPSARLRMVGDGPLLTVCRDLVSHLGVKESVDFLGAQDHQQVAREMKLARAFVQHSVAASNGDREGTPVAIIEACASGLPVVATRHAGIPEVVEHEVTGLLVAERDVSSMADSMLRFCRDPAFAARCGRLARQKAVSDFSMQRSIDGLWSIIQKAASEGARI